MTATGLVNPTAGSIFYGSYSMDLPPDEYVLSFSQIYGDYASGYWCSGPHLCPDVAAATPVTVASGGSVQVDVTMDPASTISGTILGSDGQPAAGASVGVDHPYGAQTVLGDGTFSAKVQSGSHTLFVTPGSGLPGGYYSASGPGHWTQLAADASPLATTPGTSPAALTITLPVYRTISGTLKDTGSAPVAGRWARLWQGTDSAEWSTGTPEGTFSFQAPAGGSYTIESVGSCPSANVWYKASAPNYAETQAGATVIAVGGANVTGLTLKMPSCPQVKGTITAHTGAPITAGTVYATGVDGTSGSGSATIAADGTYALAVQPGVYTLYITDAAANEVAGYYTPGGWVAADADAAHLAVGLAGLTGINLQLPAYRYITGTVTDPDGHPVQDLAVQPSVGGVHTAADGSYSLKLPSGTWTVAYDNTSRTQAGYWGGSGYVVNPADAVKVSTVAGDVAGIDVVVPFWPRVRGTVTGSSDAPLAGIKVAINAPGAVWPAASTTTADDGTYTLYVGIGYTGTHTVKAGLDMTFEEKTQDVILGAGDVNGVDFMLRSFPSVTGTVTDSSGAPLGYIDVAAWSDSTGASARTDAAGQYRIALPIGPTLDNVVVHFADQYLAHVNGYFGESGFSRQVPATFSLSIDATKVADVVLPTYRWLSGTVRDSDATPVSEVLLSSYLHASDYDTQAMVSTSFSGAFTLKLAPGEQYIAIASPAGHASGWLGDGGFNGAAPTAGAFTMPDHDLARDITLPPVIHLSGHVSTPMPIVDSIEVDILLNGAAYATTGTAGDGSWSVDVAPGAYTVGIYDPTRRLAHGWVGISGFTLDPAAARIVPVASADVTGIDITLPRNVNLKGTVRDTADRAHPYVYTEVWINGRYYDQTWTAGDGTYTLPVPAGSSARVWMYDANLKLAPGWRTAKVVTANPALAAATRIGAKGVAGVNLVAPAARFIGGTVTAANMSGATVALKKAYVGAYAYGYAASLAIAGAGGKFKVPVLPGTYTVWSDVVGVVAGRSATYAGGWYRPGGITTSASLATKVTPPAAGSTLAIRLAKPAWINGALLSSLGTRIEGVVVVFANGVAYDSVATSGGNFTISVPQGTYRVGAYDPFDTYREGWYEETTGYTASYGLATNVAAATWTYANVGIWLPPDSPPGAPTGVTAVPYHASALVSWTGPATTPSRPIIHSTVTAGPGGRWCTTTGTACTVTGLTDGTAYTFTVAASSNVGVGTPSLPTALVTPLAVPEAPAAPTVEPAGLTPTASWSAAADNGSPITGYTVTASPGGATCAAAAGATSCQFDPLPEGWYRFSVSASNALGEGPDSPASALAAADATPPVIGAPSVALRAGVAMSSAAVPVLATWPASDAVSGVASTSLELATDGGAFVPVTLGSAAATSWAGTLAAGSAAYRLRDEAADALGNVVAGPVAGPVLHVSVTEESGAGTATTGTWLTQITPAASGGRTRYAKTAGATCSFTFTGRSVAWVSRGSWAGGRAAVYVDGVRAATVSLNRAPVNRLVAWSRTWASTGKHTIRIVALDTGARADVDAFEVIK
ncbi:MAG: fibronectin type III domain-containing protein [Chloroflexota bacterium]